MVKIVWTEISIADLKEIHDFISNASIRYAKITVSNIYAKVQIIKTNRFSGRIVPEINDKYIRELISGNYRIIFKVINANQVDILRIYHSARLLTPKIL